MTSPNILFVPRSLNYKTGSTKLKTKNVQYVTLPPQNNRQTEIKVSSFQNATLLEDNCPPAVPNTPNDEVKKLSSEQRWPDIDEPVCVVCGKYGEYICDKTDEDICSLECKYKHLNCNIVDDLIASNEFNELSFASFYESRVKYKLHPVVASMASEKLNFIRDKFEIKVKGLHKAPILLEFRDFNFPTQLFKNLEENNYKIPTPVQMQVVPLCMLGHDVLVSAATSSGKTASFLLPIIWAVHECVGLLPRSHNYCSKPIALVIAPTRELCIQIEEQAKALSKSIPNFSTALLIGGNPLPIQLHRLKHKIQLVIGTPGRLNDILQNHKDYLCFDQIKIVAIDEVDVMLHMGFENQIKSIIDAVPWKPQMMMFSATIPLAIETLAQSMMENPVMVSVGISGLPNAHVKQLVLWVEEASKRKKLFTILNDSKYFTPPMLIFVESKKGADLLCDALTQKFSLKCESMHSDKTQSERTLIVNNFLTGSFDILVSTNILGRGIDLPNVRQVLLFDFPNSIEEYVHQVGRAGQLHSYGLSIAFINNSNKHIFLDLKELFETTKGNLPFEILSSPYLQTLRETRIKLYKEGKLKRKHGIDEDLNSQNLLQILTKSCKR
ncbi:uncharacterized protein LOC100210997 isoform X2 [Hydra vulgaris]|uniref:RNA helicase n=1 Tax=Hydra vulgaris TaxID=6087 RepID=A0ABM4DE15_HYDVU